MQLEHRVVLVTGAARRIGRAIALGLAREGCRLAVHYHHSRDEARGVAEQCRQCGVDAAEFSADLGAVEELPTLVGAVLERFGQLDVLVNNASVFEPMCMAEFDLTEWERTLRVNLTAPMVLAHAAQHALRAVQGRIINISDASVSRPWPDHLAYSVSKGGLDTLTQVLARAMAPEVNVVGIAPGVAQWPDDYSDDLREHLTSKIPLQRAGTPEDIAKAVRYVLRDGDYITGTVFAIDGGRSNV